MSKSNLITPDFTEDIVGFMIQSMLTITRFPRALFAMFQALFSSLIALLISIWFNWWRGGVKLTVYQAI
jgi:hypothetical protein